MPRKHSSAARSQPGDRLRSRRAPPGAGRPHLEGRDSGPTVPPATEAPVTLGVVPLSVYPGHRGHPLLWFVVRGGPPGRGQVQTQASLVSGQLSSNRLAPETPWPVGLHRRSVHQHQVEFEEVLSPPGLPPGPFRALRGRPNLDHLPRWLVPPPCPALHVRVFPPALPHWARQGQKLLLCDCSQGSGAWDPAGSRPPPVSSRALELVSWGPRAPTVT